VRGPPHEQVPPWQISDRVAVRVYDRSDRILAIDSDTGDCRGAGVGDKIPRAGTVRGVCVTVTTGEPLVVAKGFEPSVPDEPGARASTRAGTALADQPATSRAFSARISDAIARRFAIASAV
jgi:hypothetical protein